MKQLLWHLFTTTCLLVMLIVAPIRSLRSPSIAHQNHLLKGTKTFEQQHSKTRLKRSISQADIKCDQESLLAILEKCENAAKVSVGSTNSNRRRKRRRSSDSQSFCGSSCSHLVFAYTNVCGLQEFIVNVSGACKLSGSDFRVNCIHAAVVVKPGIVSCMNTHQESVSHNVSHLVDASRVYRQSQCCSLRTSYNSSLPGHELKLDPQLGDFRVDPPLIPPWKEMALSEYQPVLDITRTALCEKEMEKSNKTEAPDGKHEDMTGMPLNSSSKQNNAVKSNAATLLTMLLYSLSIVLLLFGL